MTIYRWINWTKMLFFQSHYIGQRHKKVNVLPDFNFVSFGARARSVLGL